MMSLKPIEWLAFQRLYFSKPKKGLELLQSGRLTKKDVPLSSREKKDLDRIQKLGLELITWGSDRYPKILKQIYDPPLVLLVKGKWSPWDSRPWVAVVGARKATEFGRKKVREIVNDLVKNDLGIVSGLAFGIDGEAHKACVESGGVTWGVLGCGPDRIYPATNRSLAEKMTMKGGYLSEFPLGTTPLARNFPQRNRIISGLSFAVIIVEATFRSGSLITARYALEQGREVFVVSPPKEHVAYEGTKKLLDEGATPYEDVEQVLDLLANWLPGAPGTEKTRSFLGQPKKSAQLSPRQSFISRKGVAGLRDAFQHPSRHASSQANPNPLLFLLKRPRSLDYLVDKMHMPINRILMELTLLESQGLVKKIPGALWQSL